MRDLVCLWQIPVGVFSIGVEYLRLGDASICEFVGLSMYYKVSTIFNKIF